MANYTEGFVKTGIEGFAPGIDRFDIVFGKELVQHVANQFDSLQDAAVIVFAFVSSTILTSL